MASGYVSKIGKGKLIFLEEGAKVNARYYQQILREHLIEIQQLSGNRPYTLQQDGATSHTAPATITFIEQSVPDYIEKDNWPSNSCDRNPLDYSIWGVMDQRVYKDIRVFETVNELKAKVQREWDSLS